jgi:hypothetical protein
LGGFEVRLSADLEALIEADRVGTPVQFNSSGAGTRRDQGFDDDAVVAFR